MDTQSVTDPSHYDIHVAGNSCEVYDIQRALLDRWELDAFSGHCLATAVKYIFRCGHKGGVAAAIGDLGKALFYVALALAQLNHGVLPIQLVERLKRMTPPSADLFPPVESSDEDACKDGFCPIRTPVDPSASEQGIHPAARPDSVRGIDVAQVSTEKAQEILSRNW